MDAHSHPQPEQDPRPQPNWLARNGHWFALGAIVLSLVAIQLGTSSNGNNGNGAAVLAQQPFIDSSINFAGERVPLEDEDIAERYERELLGVQYYQSNTLMLMKRGGRWFPRIEAILKQYQLPEDIKYVAAVESHFEQKSSPRGAAGFWQMMEPTAREFGLEINDEVDERYHLDKATHAACKYFRRTWKSFGSYTSSLASYNMGQGALQRSMQQQQQSNFYDLLLNTETSRYVLKVVAVKQLMSQPSTYGYHLKAKDYYKPLPTKAVRVNSSIPNLSEWALQQGINYRLLKLHNPWLRKNSLTIRNGKQYDIEIPLNPRLSKAALETEVVPEEVEETEALPGNADVESEPDPKEEENASANEPAAEGDTSQVANKEVTTPATVEKPAASNEKVKAESSSEPKFSKRKERPATHTVTRGESLGYIAQKYNMPLSELAKLNKLKVNSQVQIGQKLKLK